MRGGTFLSHSGLLAKPEHRHTCTARWRGGGDTQSWGQSPGMAPSGHPGRGPRGGRGQPPPGAAGLPPHGLPRPPRRQRPGHSVNLRLLRAARFLPAPPSPAATRHFPPPFYTLDHQRDFLGRGSQSDSGNASPSHRGTSHGRTRRVCVCVPGDTGTGTHRRPVSSPTGAWLGWVMQGATQWVPLSWGGGVSAPH